ncbi:hypothetical protein D039_3107A, partial [Vibrio parahaemolyticus EKP-028]
MLRDSRNGCHGNGITE